MRRHFAFIVLILTISLANVASAQWTKSVALNTSYDDNAFRNYAEVSDYATQVSLYLAKDSSGRRWLSRFFYKGNYTLFGRYAERNYHVHHMGAAWSRIFGNDRHRVNFGINSSLRANRTLYDYYNFKEASGYGNVKVNVGPSTATHFGYKLRVRWYSNIPDLSYAEHYLFARLTHAFATKTTVMVSGNYSHKTYREQVTSTTLPEWSDPDGSAHHGGRGHMGWRDGGIQTGESGTPQPSIGQWIGQVRIAQSLSTRTGLSLNLILRRSQDTGIRYLTGQASGYTTEDELFDDRYGYQSEELSATLTQLLPLHLTFKAGVDMRWKDYIRRPALDLTGEPLSSGALRSDRQIQTWLRVSKQITVLGGRAAALTGEFYWMDNLSNDAYYQYQVRLFSLGLSTAL